MSGLFSFIFFITVAVIVKKIFTALKESWDQVNNRTYNPRPPSQRQQRPTRPQYKQVAPQKQSLDTLVDSLFQEQEIRVDQTDRTHTDNTTKVTEKIEKVANTVINHSQPITDEAATKIVHTIKEHPVEIIQSTSKPEDTVVDNIELPHALEKRTVSKHVEDIPFPQEKPSISLQETSQSQQEEKSHEKDTLDTSFHDKLFKETDDTLFDEFSDKEDKLWEKMERKRLKAERKQEKEMAKFFKGDDDDIFGDIDDFTLKI